LRFAVAFKSRLVEAFRNLLHLHQELFENWHGSLGLLEQACKLFAVDTALTNGYEFHYVLDQFFERDFRFAKFLEIGAPDFALEHGRNEAFATAHRAGSSTVSFADVAFFTLLATAGDHDAAFIAAHVAQEDGVALTARARSEL
jgi:hypothetical protein